MAYDGDVLALVLLTAAPHRVCVTCLAERAHLEGKEAHDRVALLAETERFGMRPGLCCICTSERMTLGVADRPRLAE